MKNMQIAILITILQWQLSESRKDDSKISEYINEAVFIQAQVLPRKGRISEDTDKASGTATK